MEHTSTIGIEILLGEEDTGVMADKTGYLSFISFHINNLRNQKQKIRIESVFKALRRLHLQTSEISIDLFIISCATYAADTRVERYKFSQDGWTRRLKLFIPVSNVILWNDNKKELIEIMQFLTGDIWDFEFRLRHQSVSHLIPTNNRRTTGLSYSTDTVCLFSGGMDSFIGAYDLLKNGKRPLLLGHSKSADVSTFRNAAFESLKAQFPESAPELIKAHIRPDKIPNHEKEDTERGRSFLFLSTGILFAAALPMLEGNEKRFLLIPENGLISLNIPLSPLRLGAYSTRTTHPHLLKLVQRLIDNLALNVEIFNPYEFLTKGEMLIGTEDPEYIAGVKTMSCSRPATRNAYIEGKGYKHCGRCVPCIIRRAALKKANIVDENEDPAGERKYRLDFINEDVSAANVKGENIMAFKYMINKMMQKPNYLKANIRMTGPLENVEDYIEMYKRGIEEVNEILNNVQIVT